MDRELELIIRVGASWGDRLSCKVSHKAGMHNSPADRQQKAMSETTHAERTWSSAELVPRGR